MDEEPETVSFSVNRMPKEGFKMFKELANEMYAGDYGMTIMALIQREDLRAEFYDMIEDVGDKISEVEQKVGFLMQEYRDKEDDNSQDNKTLDTLG